MSRNGTRLIGFVLAIAALSTGVYLGQQDPRPPPQDSAALATENIDALFASTLRDTNGEAQALAQWRGKTLVVNFWASWCPPCREEMPGFSRLQLKHAANGVQFVGIALDSEENVKAFAKDFPVAYPLLLGGEAGTDLARRLGDTRLALPYTVLLGPAGETRLLRAGGLAERELDALLLQATRR